MRGIILCSMLVWLLVGCASPGPAISKSRMGNLEVNIRGVEMAEAARADIYIDGAYIGNPTDLKPILCLKRGERRIRVVLPGFQDYNQTILILGAPNHQVLNVYLERP